MKDGRKEVIRQAEQAVMADRNNIYASPEQNFQRIADLWNTYLEGKSEVTPYDTSIMMVLVKVARAIQSPHLIDHLVDAAGYAACAADVMPEAPETEPEEGTRTYPYKMKASYERSTGVLTNDLSHLQDPDQAPDTDWVYVRNVGGLVTHAPLTWWMEHGEFLK